MSHTFPLGFDVWLYQVGDPEGVGVVEALKKKQLISTESNVLPHITQRCISSLMESGEVTEKEAGTSLRCLMMETEIFKIPGAHLLCSLLRCIQCDYSTQTEEFHLLRSWYHFYGNLENDHIEMETLIS